MAQKRTTFSPEQEQLFSELQADGVTGTGKEFHHRIQQAVESTGLPRSVVCSKITNMRRRYTHKTKETPLLGSSGVNGYHVFCSRMGSLDNDASTRQRKWGELWRELPAHEADNYIKEAASLRKRKASELNDDEKKVAMKKHSKHIKDSMAVLHELHVNGLCVLNKGNQSFTCSSGTGDKVLESHIDQLEMDLLTSSAKRQTVDMERRELKVKIRRKLKDLYTTYKGKPSIFPYTKYNDNEVNFILHGLPPDIQLKDISTLSIEALRKAAEANLVIMRKENSVSGKENSRRKKTSPPAVVRRPSTAPANQIINGASQLTYANEERTSTQDISTTGCTDTSQTSPSSVPLGEVDGGTPIIGLDGSVLAHVIEGVNTAEEEQNVVCLEDVVPAETAMERLKALVATDKKTRPNVQKKKKRGTRSPKITTYFNGPSSPSSE